jgi:hypothetical protein
MGWYSMGRALYHLAVADAMRHHFCCPYSCLELLGPALCLKPGDVLVVRLGRLGVVVADVVPGGFFPSGSSCATTRTWTWGSSPCRGRPQLSAVQTSPWSFTGHTFLCLCLSLSLASCDSGTYGETHHRFVDLASFTNLASLADFDLLEVALTLTLTSSTPMKSPLPASPLELVELPLSSRVPVPLPTKQTSSSDSSSTLAFSTLGLLHLLLKVLDVVKEVATQHLQLELLQGFVLDAAVHDAGMGQVVEGDAVHRPVAYQHRDQVGGVAFILLLNGRYGCFPTCLKGG